MPLTNSHHAYGRVTKTFHWLTALLILTTIPIGIVATELAHRIRDPGTTTTAGMADLAALLFSTHKTIGVAIFFIALARIVWAITQIKPGLLNGDRPAEARLAETVHWLLYGSLVAVPLTGWIHHAATTGFAPIWWPFGQSLPFIPKDPSIAELSATLHYVLQWVLVAAIVLHVAGALKHHLLDRDATLRRMLPGYAPGLPTARQPGKALPVALALVVWGGVLGGAGWLGWFAPETSDAQRTAPLAQVESDWQVERGTLGITITQLGSSVTGSFADWTADITYSAQADPDGRHGSVEVTIAIGSLKLGSVTEQAMGEDFFDTQAYPTARFEADLVDTGTGKIARGTLRIRDQEVPAEMPFTVSIQGDTARAEGGLTVDRRDFGIGTGTDAESLAHSVDIDFRLTATRQAPGDGT